MTDDDVQRALAQAQAKVRELQRQLGACRHVIRADGLSMPGGQDDLVYAQDLWACIRWPRS